MIKIEKCLVCEKKEKQEDGKKKISLIMGVCEDCRRIAKNRKLKKGITAH